MSASQFPPLQSTPSTKHCTNCSTLMSLYTLPGHYNQNIEIDVCHDCNAIWFDQWESSQLSPDGTVALFQLINERGGASSTATSKFGEGLRCVTCGTGMRLTNDRVKNTRFAYQACPKGHGRLTTFYNFLAEKQFVRELTQQERAKLATSVQQIKCSSCAAPVNIGKTDACEYCRAPVSVFDREAAKKAIDHYLQERKQQVATPPASGTTRYDYSGSNTGWNTYNGVDLAADILFALGRAATRGIGSGASRAVPAAAGAAAGNAGSALADGGTAVTGGLLDSIHRDAGDAASVLPTATDALFGNALDGGGIASSAANGLMSSMSSMSSGLSGASDVTSGLLSNASDALPSATDALFGSAASAAAESSGGLLNELSNLFSSSASSSSSIADAASSIGSAASDIGGSAMDVAGDIASSSSEGIVDLVSDGIGSLLGSLFD
jgi:Transcription factor zinc-finger